MATIQNCVIVGSSRGVYLHESTSIKLENNRLSENTYGVYLSCRSKMNRLYRNTIEDNTKYGIHISDSCSSNTVSDNKVCLNTEKDIKDEGDNNEGFNNMCDTVEGTTGIECLPCMSLVPTGCSCSSCSECNTKLKDASCSTVTLTHDITGVSGTCVGASVSFTNKVFDCQNHKISGSGSGYGIGLSFKTGNTIKNCTITGFYRGIYIGHHSSANTLTSNTANSNGVVGIILGSSSSSNTINSNSVCSNDGAGDFYLDDSASSNSGGDNTCGSPGKWNDIGTTGCTHTC